MKTNLDEVVIESGIPVPDPRQRINQWANVLSKMKIGDSFEYRGKTCTGPIEPAKKLGYKITICSLGVSHFRVWRIE